MSWRTVASTVSGLRMPWHALAWLCALNVVLQLPWCFHASFTPGRVLMPVGEIVALAVLIMRWPRAGGLLLAVGWFGLFVIELDRLVGVILMDQDPLFYDQLFLMRHLMVLIADLWTPWWTAGVVGSLILGLAAAVLASRAARAARPALAGRSGGLPLLIAAVLLGMLPWSIRPVRWITPELVENVHRSLEVWRGVSQAPQASPYQSFADVQLARRPDLQVFIIESYGRIIATSPMTQQDWLARMSDLDADLSASGWHAASAWCEAPVSGGRSWLADGSLLTGMPIRHESVYRHLLDHIEALPSLVSFFQSQGYRTVRVAPKDRARPGISLTNDFRFGEQVTFVDLNYTGPALGWGWIPDQYTLGYINDHVLDDAPLFLLFHMVSSHIPWDPPPPILDEWQALVLIDGDTTGTDMLLPKQTYYALRRYKRTKRVRIRRLEPDGLTMGDYATAVDYDLEILRRHLRATPPRDALVVIMGDHQPPLVGRDATMDVPVHVLSRDPALLEELLAQGFTPGLAIDPEGETAIRHEGFFSLVVRALSRCCGPSDRALPAYLPEGVPPHP